MRRYVDTPTGQMVRGVVEWAAATRHNGLITGPAGLGKTHALAEAARRDARAVFVTATPAEKTLRGTLSMLMNAFHLSSYNETTHSMHQILRSMLPGRAQEGHYLIVDEAQVLPADGLRQILVYSDHPDAPLPVVFAGNEYALKKTRANAAAFDQIMSRMAMRRQISGITPGDVDAFCVDWNVEGRDAYGLMQSFGAGRNCRELDLVLSAARSQGGPKGSIKLPAIRAALEALYGPDIADRFRALEAA